MKKLILALILVSILLVSGCIPSVYNRPSYNDLMQEDQMRDKMLEEQREKEGYNEMMRQEMLEDLYTDDYGYKYNPYTGNMEVEYTGGYYPTESTTESASTFKVTKVIDGDTIEISTGERVRLVCIDSTEAGQDYYQDAKDYLESLILNKEIRLEKDITDKDKYGRILRYIYIGDTFVNEKMVEQGYATVYRYGQDLKYCDLFEIAENKAKDDKLNIWSEVEDGIICSFNAYNCGDFSTHAEAQAVYSYCVEQGKGNIHRLDGSDNDGLACETLP